MEDQIVTIWLPTGIALAVGVIGMLRGAVREAVVAASVVLAALINTQWAGQWSDGIYELFPNMDQGQQEFALSTVVLWLVVLGLGYGLGSVLSRERPIRASRIGGFLLGLATGAAVAGFMLLYAYEFLDGAQRSSRFYESMVSRAFMIWAGWYPLVLAFVGAIVVFVGPMRRAQRAVAQPSAASNWSPTTPPQTPAPAMASTMFIPGGVVGPSSGQVQMTPYTGPGASQATVAIPVADAPPTTVMPIEPRPASAPTGTTVEGTGDDLSATRAFGDVLAPSPSALQPSVAPYESEAARWRTDAPGTFDQPSGSDSSWLLQSASDQAPSSNATPGQNVRANEGVDDDPKPMTTTTSFGTEHSILSSAAGAGGAGSPPREAAGEKKCPNCGTSVMPGASFCTNCGTRITE